MKVLLLIDKLNWAYHSIAKALIKYNPHPDVELSVMHIKKNIKAIKKQYSKFDKVFVMGWQNYQLVTFIPKKNVMVGLHSFHSWDERKTTIKQDVDPPSKLLDDLSGFSKVNAVSLRLTNLFKKHGIKVVYTPNGVDTKIFYRRVLPPVENSLVAGYSGSKAHDWRKGVSRFILPSGKKADVKVKLAMLSTDKYVPLEEMYRFYNEIDCYVCASLSEGMSLSVLEALACGRPVIGTRCSGNTELIKDGINGFFVDRSVDDICSKINKLKNKETIQNMSNLAEKDAQKNWCWSKQAKSWIDFIRN